MARKSTVTRLLADHRDILDKMSLELLEKETIVLADMERIVEELRPGKYTDKMTARKEVKASVQEQPEQHEAEGKDEEKAPPSSAETQNKTVEEPPENKTE